MTWRWPRTVEFFSSQEPPDSLHTATLKRTGVGKRRTTLNGSRHVSDRLRSTGPRRLAFVLSERIFVIEHGTLWTFCASRQIPISYRSARQQNLRPLGFGNLSPQYWDRASDVAASIT
jgi:hypothetical protein